MSLRTNACTCLANDRLQRCRGCLAGLTAGSGSQFDLLYPQHSVSNNTAASQGVLLDMSNIALTRRRTALNASLGEGFGEHVEGSVPGQAILHGIAGAEAPITLRYTTELDPDGFDLPVLGSITPSQQPGHGNTPRTRGFLDQSTLPDFSGVSSSTHRARANMDNSPNPQFSSAADQRNNSPNPRTNFEERGVFARQHRVGTSMRSMPVHHTTQRRSLANASSKPAGRGASSQQQRRRTGSDDSTSGDDSIH